MGRAQSRRGTSARLDALLSHAQAAFEDGRVRDALTLSEAALARDPRSADALHYRAAAHVALGQLTAADEAYQRAVERAPRDLDILLGAVELALCHRGDDRLSLERGLALCSRAKRLATGRADREARFELLLLEGIGRNQLGESEAAIAALNEALTLVPSSLDARLERAIARFELGQLGRAEDELRAICRASPDEAWAHHHLGLIAERRGRSAEAERRFARARALAPDELPQPIALSDAELDAAVEEAIAQLPEPIRRQLAAATVTIESIPADEDLRASAPPLSPLILGVYREPLLGEAGGEQIAASIVLYQRNLERFARTRRELIEQIGITLLHELGHLIGLDEEQLQARGLE